MPRIARGEDIPMNKDDIILPEPRAEGIRSVEEAMRDRRSVRSFDSRELTEEQVSQLVWSAQGVTDSRHGYRAVPSAGALYPLEVFLVKSDGVFRYIPDRHALHRMSGANVKTDLTKACWGQSFVGQAPVAIVIGAVYERVTKRYGQRGVRYTDIEVGHAGQNISLQAVALGLSTVMIGAFDDSAVSKVLALPKDVQPLYVIPVGYKK
ncbi:MAG: SagB/ThcOx family dehydrogenase [Candidatus Omnitrophota bacterium]